MATENPTFCLGDIFGMSMSIILRFVAIFISDSDDYIGHAPKNLDETSSNPKVT